MKYVVTILLGISVTVAACGPGTANKPNPKQSNSTRDSGNTTDMGTDSAVTMDASEVADEGTDGATNAPPVADAGDDVEVTAGNVVTLDGSASSDPDGDELSFQWTLATLPDGSTASLLDSTTAAPRLATDLEGSYVVELVVDDGSAQSAVDAVLVTATSEVNEPPIAVAGSDVAVDVGESVQLDGTDSSDPEGSALSYSWSVASAPAGSSATLSDTQASMPTFAPDVAGPFEIRLIVNDGAQNSAPDSMQIVARQPAAPCLVFSEVLEGTGNNKAYEVYNCGDESITLNEFYVCLVANDDTDCSGYLQLGGALGAGGVYGVCHADLSAAIADLSACDVPSSITSHVSGNDRLVLFRDDDASGDWSAGDPVLDAFGEIAVNPGDVWQDVTMRRCDWSVPYDGTTPFMADAWYTTHPVDDFSDFGVPPTSGCP